MRITRRSLLPLTAALLLSCSPEIRKAPPSPSCDISFEERCDGTCVWVYDDPENCGACGRSCGGFACDVFHCQPGALASIPSPSSLDKPSGMAVSATDLYWSHGGEDHIPRVMKLSKDGGMPVEFYAGEKYRSHGRPATDGANLYWTLNEPSGSDEPSLGAILWAPLSGGAPASFPTVELAHGITTDGVRLYWQSNPLYSSESKVMTAPVGGGTNEVVATGTGWLVTDVRVDESDVYWVLYEEDSNDDPPAKVMKAPKEGGAPVTVVEGIAGRASIALDASHLYWANALTLWKMPKSGGDAVEVVTIEDDKSSLDPLYRRPALAVDEMHVYWGSMSGLRRVPLDGGPVEALRSRIRAPLEVYDVALDATSVYWFEYVNGAETTLYKVPKGFVE